MNEKEIRKVVISDLETRATEDNMPVIEGYINKFNERSQYMGFYEYVDSRAFDKTLAEGNNIMALYDHDSSKILGSTRSGSLTLSVDEVGLRFSLKPNMSVSYAKDVVELVRSGDLAGASFGFTVSDDDWEEKDGEYHRTLKEINLFEVTLTAFPAYVSSEVHSRSFDVFKENQEELRKSEQKKQEMLKKQRQIAIDLELLS